MTMADETPPRPKPDIDTKAKDLEAEDRLGNFEIQSLAADPDDREEIPDLDAELLDIALMEDPDAGGEVFGQATLQATPIDDGGEIAMPADDGGEIARKAGGGQHEVHSDPEGGGELARGPRTEVRDAHDRFAEATRTTGDPVTPIDDGGEIGAQAQLLQATPIDDGGEILGDPDGGGEATLHRAAFDGIDGESTTKDHTGQLAEDPDAGGEVAATTPATPPGVPVPYPNLADDPDGGGEVDGGFGTGALPPRPVTMTADDLRSDPEGGGEVAGAAQAGGEVVTRPPLDGIGVDDLTVAEDPDGGGAIARSEEGPEEEDPMLMVDTFAPAPIGIPEPEVTDLELASDFDQAGHTFDGE
jgi:hypothetical protein